MTSMFRSEEMTLCQLFLQSESAYACVSELGELGLVEFRDLNPEVNAFQRKFVNEVRRCDEMERKLRFMTKEIEKAEIPFPKTIENPSAPHPREMIDMESQFLKLELEMKDSNNNFETLMKTLLELTELKHILKKTQTLFDEGAETQIRLETEHLPEGHLGFVAGVITRDKINPLERILWRACRGNVFFKQAEIEEPLEDPVTNEKTHKCVFVIFFQGEHLKLRVNKICEGFRATLYPCPETPIERREMAVGVMTRIDDLQAVIQQSKQHRHEVLQTVVKNIHNWLIKVQKIKAIYHTMNMFNLDVTQKCLIAECRAPVIDIEVQKIKAIYHTMNMFNLDVTQKCLIAECWAPVNDIEGIEAALRRGKESSGASVPSILNRTKTKHTPPTYNRTNKFTYGFQNIVNAYGVANYEEVNPALYTLITFPFLFSVMFGDFGHGIIMAVFAFMLILYEEKLANSKAGGQMFETIYHGRYIVFLMGLFSIHSGLLYNDSFCKSLNIFGSSWVAFNRTSVKARISDYNLTIVEHSKGNIMFNPYDTARATPYYFGIDPIWQLAINKLTFTNSLKMKISIIFGVTHMTFGVILGIFNHLHFKNYLNIWCEFIPQLLFISCIFGYLVILIFYKWIRFSIHDQYQPSLLLGLIGMFLSFGSPKTAETEVYHNQTAVEAILVVVAVLAVPWMLLIKPFILKSRAKKKQQVYAVSYSKRDDAASTHNIVEDIEGQTQNDPDLPLQCDDEDEEPFQFGEVFIHQAIHTIEYCLGCISNTASYLRLWALSLAHAQLSEVLWNMVFKIGLGMTGGAGMIATFIIFAAWACLTVAILLVMEGLSAFLHTLRLHWVEFNSKFYLGQGRLFEPFSFKQLLSGESG